MHIGKLELRVPTKQDLKFAWNLTADLIFDTAEAGIRSAWGSVKSLVNNAESIAILTLAALGTAHFIGVIAIEHAFLATLLVSEMLSPVIAVGLIYLLIRVAMLRKKRNWKVGVA